VEALLAGLIVGVLAMLGQAWQRRGEAKIRRAEKLEDWARQDAVADKAAEAASLLLIENAKVAKATEATQGKLDVIHILVNSNMTAAMQSELDATRRDLVSLKEVARLNEEAGRKVSAEALAVIDETGQRIAKLDAELRDRLKQTQIADKEGRA
jgi:hypothetical protein